MVEWDQVDTVLLDMDGTLLDLHFDNYFWLKHLPQHYAEINDLDPDSALEQLVEQFKRHEGSLNWYCIDFWSQTLEIDIPKLKQEIQHKIQFRPKVKGFLQQLQDSDKRTLIVTNAHQESINLKLASTELNTLVDGILCSHDFDAPKEDPAFWHKFQITEPFDKKSTLLIDDSLPVLRAAQAYGIGHLLTILKPDSQQPKRDITEFVAVDCFEDLKLAEAIDVK